jgi:hypothetical protein
VRLLLQPPQSRFVPCPLRLLLQMGKIPQPGLQSVVRLLGLFPVGRSKRASKERYVRCCELDVVNSCTFRECHNASFWSALSRIRALSES